MFDFSLDITEVGNPMLLGVWEEQQQEKVEQTIDWLKRRHGYTITQEELDNACARFDVDYFHLPQWLAREFDQFYVM